MTYLALAIVAFGIYSLYYYVTVTEENLRLLAEINTNLSKPR